MVGQLISFDRNHMDAYTRTGLMQRLPAWFLYPDIEKAQVCPCARA